MEKKTVAVVFGGQSSEHEVSRVSAQSVLENINREKFNVKMFGITKEGRWLEYSGDITKIGSGEWEQIQLLSSGDNVSEASTSNGGSNIEYKNALCAINNDENKIDVVFPVLHGCNGEDGTIQGMLEMAGIPYVGCGVLASAVGMDKVYTKMVFEHAGIPQGKYIVVKRKEISSRFKEIELEVGEQLGYPCFVKPSNAGSSVGVSKVANSEQLHDSLLLAAKYDRKILVEEFIDGRELECAVLGNDDPKASVVGEIVPCNDFYDYKAKYIDGDSAIIIPADVDEATAQQVQLYARKAFSALDCSGLSRVDFFLRKKDNKILINEINTLPGFTSISMYPKLWEESGVSYGELIETLIELALERFEDNKRLLTNE